MLLTKTVNICPNRNKEHYKSLGYRFRGFEKIDIMVHDLPLGSVASIEFQCDKCNDIVSTPYRAYMKKKNKNLCNSCASIKRINETQRTFIICNECNDMFHTTIHLSKIRKFCSIECYWTSKTKPSLNRQRRLGGYYKWKNLVKVRDDYQCQRCDESENIQAHHIKPYGKYVSERWNVDNGVILCYDCHSGFHSKYGIREFGRRELDEWLMSIQLQN